MLGSWSSFVSYYVGSRIVHWGVHWLPVSVFATRLQKIIPVDCISTWRILFLLNLRQLISTSSLSLLPSRHIVVLRKQEDGLQSHRFALKSSICNVIIRGSVLHHIVNTTFAFIGVKNLFDPSSRWPLIFLGFFFFFQL